MPKNAPLAQEFRKLLDDVTSSEQDLQDFLEKNTTFFYPAFALNHGVHLAVLISKFKLDTSLICDFAYLTKSSNEWWIVLVEIEQSAKRLFTKAALPSSELTAAIGQVNTWRTFIDRNCDEVVRKLSPLRKPLERNQVKFKYVLVIGRTTEYEKDHRAVDALAQAQRDDFRIMTFDSLLHSYEAERNITLDVLTPKGQKFALKYRHRNETLMFAWLSQNDICLNSDDVAFYKSHGFDIDAWLKGQSLAVDGKDTKDKFLAQFTSAISSAGSTSAKGNKPA